MNSCIRSKRQRREIPGRVWKFQVHFIVFLGAPLIFITEVGALLLHPGKISILSSLVFLLKSKLKINLSYSSHFMPSVCTKLLNHLPGFMHSCALRSKLQRSQLRRSGPSCTASSKGPPPSTPRSCISALSARPSLSASTCTRCCRMLSLPCSARKREKKIHINSTEPERLKGSILHCP